MSVRLGHPLNTTIGVEPYQARVLSTIGWHDFRHNRNKSMTWSIKHEQHNIKYIKKNTFFFLLLNLKWLVLQLMIIVIVVIIIGVLIVIIRR